MSAKIYLTAMGWFIWPGQDTPFGGMRLLIWHEMDLQNASYVLMLVDFQLPVCKDVLLQICVVCVATVGGLKC